MSKAINEVGAQAGHLGTTARNRDLLRDILASDGIVAADATCYLDRVIPAFGADAFGQLTVYAIVVFTISTDRALPEETRTAAEGCWSTDSKTRYKANRKAAGNSPKQLAPDFDVTASRVIRTEVQRVDALAVGLTPEEATCVAEHTFGQVDDTTFRSLITGSSDPAIHRIPVTAVAECVSAERLAALRPDLQRRTEELRAADRAERERVQQSIDDEVRRLQGQGGSTSAPAVSTTSATQATQAPSGR